MSVSGPGGSGRVIVVGSVNVDLVMRLPRLPAPGETVLGGVLGRHHGGKGANQAVAAARAGASVAMIGAVGAQDGQEPLDELAAEGIEVTHVLRAAGPTGHAVVLVDAGTGENQIAVAPGANDLVTADFVAAALEALGLGPTDVVVLSFELPGTPLLLAADLARAAGARLVVNPAPAHPELISALTGAVVTPNQHELAAYQGSGQTGSAALALSARTGAPVLVTLGPAGALLAADGQAQHFAAHQMDAVDTTGAGDTLTGVLAASLAAGLELRAAVRRAVAAAALSVTKPGARAGMPDAAAIDAVAGGP